MGAGASQPEPNLHWSDLTQPPTAARAAFLLARFMV